MRLDMRKIRRPYWFNDNEIEEIHYALSCKIQRIKHGDYTQTIQERKTDPKWIKDLEKIQRRLQRGSV